MKPVYATAGSGAATLTVVMDLIAEDSRGNRSEGEMVMQGEVLYDRGRAATTGLSPVDDPRSATERGHPYRFTFPGTDGVQSFDLYPDPRLQMVPGP